MILSEASGTALDQLRRIAGPNPKGSKLTDTERLHLLYNLTAVVGGILSGDTVGHATLPYLSLQLVERGMSPEDIKAVFHKHLGDGPVPMANAIAVHPSLRDNDYLD